VKLDTETGGRAELVLELTPMIDVVFLLLIFFMLATTFADPEREIELDLPEAASSVAKDTDREELIINVLSDGSVRLGEASIGAEALLAQLVQAARSNPDRSVTIRGDREARHEAIVAVMDACGQAGLRNLAVGTIEGS
jgi:biopolymer transport protein ExbD